MKTLLYGLLAISLCASAPIAIAQTDDAAATETKTVKKTKAAGDTAVAKSLKKVKSFNGRINKKAKYYVYLQSASWCGPCRAEMPEIAEQYSDMERQDIEIILCSCDQTKNQAKNFLKSNKAKFPATMQEDAKELPGFVKARGIPYAIFVTADGETITSGHGSIVKNWKAIIEQWEASHPADSQTDDSSAQ